MVDRSPGFFDIDLRLADLSAKGDNLERVKALVAFEIFRPALEAAVPRADRSKGGRPAFDHVLMFKVLILQAMHSLSDERAEYLIKDRLSFMRFLGLGLADAVPDANTIWTFREALKRADAVDGLFRQFDDALHASGFGYKNHVAIDRGFGLIRNFGHERRRARRREAGGPAGSDEYGQRCLGDTAYRSAKNEAMLARRGLVSRIHRKKPKGKPMPERIRIANAQKSKVRSAVEHVFAHQKGLMGLCVRTIGIARAKVKIGLANLAYNMRHFVWLRAKYADG